VLSLAGTAVSVEKKKTDKSKSKQEQVEPKKDSNKAEHQKKYDNFIDNNRNGVDDRRENLKKKSGPEADKPDKTKPAEPKKPDSTKGKG
jgi:hypothetical protein